MNSEEEEKESYLYYITTCAFIFIALCLIFLLFVLFKYSHAKKTLTQNKNLLISSIFLSITVAVSPLITEGNSIPCKLQGSFNYLFELSEKCFTLVYSIFLFILIIFPGNDLKIFDIVSICLVWIFSIIFGIICYIKNQFEFTFHFCEFKADTVYHAYLLIAITITLFNIALLIFTLVKVLEVKRKQEKYQKENKDALIESIDSSQYNSYALRLALLISIQVFTNIPFIINIVVFIIGKEDEIPFWLTCFIETIYTLDPLVISGVYIIDYEVYTNILDILGCRPKKKKEGPNAESFEFSIENIFEKTSTA